jgi:uncharacterized protein YegP (UPF0339 family)
MPNRRSQRYFNARLFRDSGGQWRWHIKTRNGRIVATCGEGYRRRIDCIRILRRFLPALGLDDEDIRP